MSLPRLKAKFLVAEKGIENWVIFSQRDVTKTKTTAHKGVIDPNEKKYFAPNNWNVLKTTKCDQIKYTLTNINNKH